MSQAHRPYNVLFICTGNSARSIMAEALMNRLGDGRFKAYSAGPSPTGEINPHVTPIVESLGFETADFRSKSWDEFAEPGAPQLDFIFTVCASAAGEACPVWPGHPATAHWGIADPAHVEPLAARRAAFETAYGELENRIAAFLKLPLETLPTAAIVEAAKKIHSEASA